MNKFMKVSLIIVIPLTLLVGFFTITLKDMNYDSSKDPVDRLTIEYKDYKEEKNSHIITVIVKNNSNSIADLNDLELCFDYINNDEDMDYGQNDIYIKGYEKDEFDEDKERGIDPGHKTEIIFRIPKAITFDEEKFELKHPIVEYSANFYKFRKGKTTLMIGTGSQGGTRTLNMNQ